MNATRLTKYALDDGESAFEALILEPAEPCISVLFAVGAGGDPERHLPLLQVLAAQPPGMAQMLEGALHGIVPVEVRIVADAGHFSFMNMPPPQAVEPLAGREAVLERLAKEVADFITS